MRSRKIMNTAALAALMCIGATAANAKALIYCLEGSPENFNPAMSPTNTSLDASRHVYDQLVEFERGTTNLKPGLAQSWDFSDGGKTITFHLRKGVKFGAVKDFTPTRDFNADDVLFSFNRQLKEDHPYHMVSGGKYDTFNDMDMGKIIASIEKKDDYTVVFKLSEPNAAFMANLGMDFASIGSAEYADMLMKKGTPEQIDQVPVGTGPYSFVAYQKDAVIRFKARPDYWGGAPAIEDYIISIVPDPTVRFAKLKAGECTLMGFPRPSDLPEMEKDKTLQVLHQPGLNVSYWTFNEQKKPFDDVRVRQALIMAIDKAAIIRDVFGSTGQAAKNPIPPTIWSYNDKVKDYPHDPEKAKALLKEAGVKTPLDIDLWYIPVQRPYNPNAKRIAEMMQADLAKIGVNAKLVTYEWGEYRKRIQQGEEMTGQMGWTGDNGDPDNFFFLMGCAAARAGGQNIARFCDKDFEDKLQKARQSTDKEERSQLYEDMQVIAHDKAVWFTIAHSVVYEAAKANLTGYKVSPLGRHEFAGADLK
jgi:dipeptide transport system substrate-binding protein